MPILLKLPSRTGDKGMKRQMRKRADQRFFHHGACREENVCVHTHEQKQCLN